STAAIATTGRLPWFVDPAPFLRQKAPHLVQNGPTPLPEGVPTVIRNLHATLKTSPHLEQSELLVCEPIPTPPGPPLPDAMPKGRRKRGRAYAGEGVTTGMVGGLWNWIVLAQVKEGTENRGAIEAVVRVVRKSLLQSSTPVTLPPNSKRRSNDGWTMIDAGEFAVHVVSREARARFFPSRTRQF
ncbi:hypothetical protein BDM02DRAFT_3079313, partial [Thelephora ganbajun]